MRGTAVPEQKLDTHSFRLGHVPRLGTCGTCWGVVHARLGWAKRERLLRGRPRSRFLLSGHEIGGAAGRQHLIGAELGIDPSAAYDAVQRAAQMIPTEG